MRYTRVEIEVYKLTSGANPPLGRKLAKSRIDEIGQTKTFFFFL